MYGVSSSTIMQHFRANRAKWVPFTPRSGMQFLKLAVLRLKPRISQTDLVSLHLSNRVNWMQEFCARGFTFPSESGATPYSPRFRDNCPDKRNSKKCFSRSLGMEIRRLWEKRASFREEETASRRVFASLFLKQEFR